MTAPPAVVFCFFGGGAADASDSLPDSDAADASSSEEGSAAAAALRLDAPAVAAARFGGMVGVVVGVVVDALASRLPRAGVVRWLRTCGNSADRAERTLRGGPEVRCRGEGGARGGRGRGA